MAGDRPDILVGCIGGGSNFGGFVFPFLQDKLNGRRKDLRVIAVEPHAAPSLTKGEYVYDFGDTGQMTPLVKMYTLGHSFIPAPIHAGGLRYHGMAPLVCALYDHKVIEAVAVHQNPTFEAALTFARAEGFLPAPEAAHAIRCKVSGDRKVIAFNFCGHGHFDLSAYERYMTGKLEDFEYPAEKVKEALSGLPKVKV
jgi:tryptophan synthase beta chain